MPYSATTSQRRRLLRMSCWLASVLRRPNFDPNLPALITAKVAVDHKGPFLSISYKQLPHPIAPSDPSFDPTFQPPPGISPALFRIRRVVHDIHSKSRPMAGFRPATPPSNL